jgi:hypothetical protein
MLAHQTAWWMCVLLMGWIGPVSMLAFVLLHLLMTRDEAALELRLIALSMGIGIVLDSLLAVGGLVTYEGAPLVGLSPLWLVAIWAGFGATLRHSQALFVRTRLHATLTGALGGPLAYMGGTKLGALSVHGTGGYVGVGVLWLLALLALERAIPRASDT